jgi:DnaD/phage-associated family protein
VINARHEIVGAFAGDCEQAHLAGTTFLNSLCQCPRTEADIVITSNNGYPLDQNIYQAVKGMTSGEATCKEGGVIIMSAACNDGHGGEAFRQTMSQPCSASQILAQIESTPKQDTLPDQWQSQIFARILSRFHVVLVTQADPELVRAMKMHPAATLEEAIAFIQNQNVRASRMGRLMELLQIRGRSLTQAETRYATGWIEMGFSDELIAMAYERTCLNTGGLSWPYMNKILTSWHNAGYKTTEQIQNGDRKKNVPKGASGELGEAEMEAIRRLLQEG